MIRSETTFRESVIRIETIPGSISSLTCVGNLFFCSHSLGTKVVCIKWIHLTRKALSSFHENYQVICACCIWQELHIRHGCVKQDTFMSISHQFHSFLPSLFIRVLIFTSTYIVLTISIIFHFVYYDRDLGLGRARNYR